MNPADTPQSLAERPAPHASQPPEPQALPARRSVLLAGCALLLAGCETTTALTDRPRPTWPTVSDTPTTRTTHRTPAASPPRTSAAPRPIQRAGGLPVVARSAWASRGPNPRRVNPMAGVQRITIHHEGWRPVYFDSSADTADRIELIRASHVERRGWGDIGYHYIVDRAGRVWEGRSPSYQGAHVRDRNPHNLGVLVLGNFEQQAPSDAQLGGLNAALRALATKHRVPASRIHTHRELNPTACPGRHLQPRAAAIRNAMV
ncbi:MAG: N-acetylmuramoyl-L-alanine amidase [Planctomycetota bacterium]